MEKFDVICCSCLSGQVEIKGTSTCYGARIRVKVHCKSCGDVEEISEEEVSVSLADFLLLESQ